MQKTLLSLLALSFALLAPTAQAANYRLYVAGIQVTDDNRFDILDDGSRSVRFEGDTHGGTLTLSNAAITRQLYGSNNNGIYAGSSFSLTIVLEGTNRVESADFANGIQNYSSTPLVITGGGTLSAVGSETGILAGGGLTITDAVVTAVGSDAGIVANGGLTVTDAVVTATGTAIVGITCHRQTLSITGESRVTAKSGNKALWFGELAMGEGVSLLLPEGGEIREFNASQHYKTVYPAGSDEAAKSVVIGVPPPVPYVERGWDGHAVTESNAVCTRYTAYTNQTTLTNGWYVVKGAFTNADRITVSGEVHLILCDGAVLTATNGIALVGTNNILAVYGQTNGTGRLFAGTDGRTDGNGQYIATCGEYFAGIGGGSGASGGGTVAVYGGTVTAQGGDYAAGIGGGGNGAGGTVTVYGGTVTAWGDGGGAGIGGGGNGAGGTVTVYGGTVTARGNGGGTGIGGGCWAAGGDVAIHGGTVTATATGSDECGAAIGKGCWGASDGGLDIAGMKVTYPPDTLAAERGREKACRAEGGTVTLEVCTPHAYENGACKWCNAVEPVQVVTFNGNDGTPETATNRYAWGEPYGWLPGATRLLHTFGGWQATNGTEWVDVTTNDIVTEESARTLVAQWEDGVVVSNVLWLCAMDDNDDLVLQGADPAEGNLVMPGELDGYPVARVGGSAFKGRSNLTGMVIADGVTRIGQNAFENCTALTDVVIPDSVTAIGDSAFWGCTNLTDLAIGAGVTEIMEYAFFDCSALTDVTIPDSVMEIRYHAFDNCTSLTNVWLGTGIETIEVGTFRGCTNLATVWVPVEKKDADLQALAELPEGCTIRYYGEQVVTFLGNGGTPETATNRYAIGGPYAPLPAVAWPLHTFRGWQTTNGTAVTTNDPVTEEAARTLVAQWTNGVVVSNVLWTCQTNFDGSSVTVTRADPAEGDLVMPDTLDGFPVTAVWPYAFANCTNLTGMAIADGVTFIGEAAFENCTALTDLVIPDGVTEIGSHVFDGCSGLTNLVIGAGVTFIDSGAFYKCSGLTDVTIPDGVTHIGPSAFYGCSGLTNVTIGAGVTMIESCAFKGCSGLTEVVIPDGVTEIDDLTFQDCSGLANVIIGAGVTNIGDWAFSGTALTDVTIPDAVATIDEFAFRDCASLTNVWLGTGVGTIEADAFAGCTNLATIWLPVEKKGSDLLYNAGVPDGCTIRYYGTQVVTFDANGGSCATKTNTYAFGAGRTYGDLPEATRADWDFLGWFDAANGGTQVTAATTVTEATARTLYAHWRQRAVKYQVAFAANGGKGKMAKQTMTVGKAAKLRKNAFQRKGLVFAGWGKTAKGDVAYRDQQAVKNLRTTAGTVTLHAKWAKPKYKVAFDANGGRLPKGSCMDPQTMKYGKAARLRPCRFVRSGYFFIGWAKTKDGPVAFTNQQAVKNLRRDGKTTKLYAKWARKVFYVAYDANGGKGKMANQKFIWNVADKLHANAFTREGYAFDGWAKTKTGKVAYSDRAMGNHLSVKGGTVTLYAKWKKVAVKKAATAASTAAASARSAAPKVAAAPAAPVFSVDDCGVFTAGGCELAILPDPPTVEELADREEAEELENPIAVAFRVPEGGAAWQFWSAERGLLAEDAVSAATVELALPDLGLWHWLRFFDADGGTLSSTWIFAADE